jgi:hypothetical protein
MIGQFTAWTRSATMAGLTMTTTQVVLDGLCDEVCELLHSYFGQSVGSLCISATYCELKDAPWEIKVSVPGGDVHGFAGFDARNAVRNLERFGLGVIARGLAITSSQ